MNPVISEICRKSKITEYLTSKGIRLQKCGRKWKCCCPIHQESDPSMYISVMPDDAEVFHCFGCNKSGNIITLKSEMEHLKRGTVVRDLANRLKLSLGHFDDAEKIEPLKFEILEFFCQEDNLMADLADVTLQFMKTYGTEDVINKISRVYEKMDKLSALGDSEGMMHILKNIRAIIKDYEGEHGKAN